MAEKKVVRYKLERHKWPDEIEAEKKARRKTYRNIFICILCFILGMGTQAFLSGGNVSQNEGLQKVNDAYDIMMNQFYYKKNDKAYSDQLIDGALKGLVDAGEDIHTAYFNVKESKDFSASMEGSVVGIGVSITNLADGFFLITDISKNSPAEKSGIQAGDRISKVNGISMEGKTLDELTDVIRGKEGTKVEIELIRNGNEKITKKITRQKVYGTVFSDIVGEVGLIRLNTFADTSGDEFETHLKDIKKSGCKSIVIDLRNNGGGYLYAAQQIISYFANDDEIIFQEKKLGNQIDDYYPTKGSTKYKFDKIVVLVNENSASASEVLTAALKELCNATVVGKTTYGKGTVQIPLPMSDGSLLKYTTAEWLSAKGNTINKVGISPDIEVEEDEAISLGLPIMEDNEEYEVDSVAAVVKPVQAYLQFLGYDVDRKDAYFSLQTKTALQQFQNDHNLKADGKIRKETTQALFAQCYARYKMEAFEYDKQLMKAMEVADE